MIKLPRILVSGADGQLGQSMKAIQEAYTSSYEIIYLSQSDLDITSSSNIQAVFEKYKPDFFFNFAAYTQVDLAEENKEEAFLINSTACAFLGQHCATFNTHLVHISTDYVYPGNGPNPYQEEQAGSPLNQYGASKLSGEQAIQQSNAAYTIIRTSWLYSIFGSNFVKTMYKLGMERDVLNVVDDQIGSPTWTQDLIHAIFNLIQLKATGVYNFSNEGICSWYDFAKKIMDYKGINCQIHPISTDAFPRPAERPPFSVMDKAKYKSVTGSDIPQWDKALLKMLSNLE